MSLTIDELNNVSQDTVQNIASRQDLNLLSNIYLASCVWHAVFNNYNL